MLLKPLKKEKSYKKKGDEYDNAIKKAEKEIKALENTLKIMNIKNEQYRQSISFGEITRKETEQKEILEQQYQSAVNKYKEKRQEILDFQDVLAHLEKVISSLAEDEKNHLQNIGFLESKIGTITKELDEQEQKKKRIFKITEKMIQDIKKKKGLKKNDILPEEFEVSLKELKEFYSMIINKIAELTNDNPELKEKIDEEFEKIDASLTKALSKHSLSLYSMDKLSNPNSRSNSRLSSRVSSRESSHVESGADSRVASRASSRLSNASKGSAISKVEIGLDVNSNKSGSSSSLKKSSSLTKKKSTSSTKLNN